MARGAETVQDTCIPTWVQQACCQKYTCAHALGSGSFSEVYLAWSKNGGQEVAVKATRFPPAVGEGPAAGLDAAKKDVRRRLAQDEVHIMKRLHGLPNCAQILDAFVSIDFCIVVMELCDCSLAQLLDLTADQLAESTYKRIFGEMLQALAMIHSFLVVHRDVKPENFLCCGKNLTVTLTDFGMSTVLPRHEDAAQGICGTAPFMSPEMLKKKRYGTRTDIWSFGVLAYTLLLGQFPYQPDVADPASMKAAIVAGAPRPSFGACGEGCGGGGDGPISEAARHLLRRLLCRSPESRPTAEDALEHPWFSTDFCDEASSLGPRLLSARRQGAFGRPPASQ